MRQLGPQERTEGKRCGSHVSIFMMCAALPLKRFLSPRACAAPARAAQAPTLPRTRRPRANMATASAGGGYPPRALAAFAGAGVLGARARSRARPQALR